MGLLKLCKQIHGRFSTRIFSFLIIAMLLIFSIYNLLNWQIQKKELERETIKDGKILVQFLAANVTLGVFAEDKEQIINTSSAVHKVAGVLDVFILNPDLEYLNKSNGEDNPRYECQKSVEDCQRFFDDVGRSRAALLSKHGDDLEFWAPVVIDPVSFSEDSLYFDISEQHPKSSQIIGYVGIVLDKTIQNRASKEILMKNLFIAGLFLFLSCFTTYLITREASRPINKLIKDARKIGIEVESEDEVGMLTSTFDNMIGKLSDAFLTIKDLKTDLEEKVANRTLELSKSNHELTNQHHHLEEKNHQLEDAMKKLQDTQMQLIQSEKMVAIGQLVAGVAHEVNNTTNFISGALPPLKKTLDEFKNLIECYDEAISTGNSNERAKKINKISTCRAALDYEKITGNLDILLANISEGVKRTSKIVRDLKSFSRPDDDQAREIDVHESLDITLDLLYTEYKYDIEIVRDFAANLPKLTCFPSQLSQVFMNILLNGIYAIKTMPGGKGTMKITTWVDDKILHILFKDNGLGMSKETKAQMFDPFFTTKEVGMGTGLGLSVSYGIIKKHHGEIIVSSEEGKGSEVEIIIPQNQSQPE